MLSSVLSTIRCAMTVDELIATMNFIANKCKDIPACGYCSKSNLHKVCQVILNDTIGGAINTYAGAVTTSFKAKEYVGIISGLVSDALLVGSDESQRKFENLQSFARSIESVDWSQLYKGYDDKEGY